MERMHHQSPEAFVRLEKKDILESLWKNFPLLAKNLIKKHQDLSHSRNQNFYENPDDPREHEMNFHQWGIITHTKKFEEYYRAEVPGYLKEWGVEEAVHAYLDQKIDGRSKADLLEISIPLHDLGKFTGRFIARGPGNQEIVSFKDHEEASGVVIRSPDFSSMLAKDYGLTPSQIAYVARCAELHYELGLLRRSVKKKMGDSAYCISFTQGKKFRDYALPIMQRHSDFQLEVGLLFLADSLAKTDIRIPASTDQDIKREGALVAEILEQRGLPKQLERAVKQLPVNRAAAENYLKMWAQKNPVQDAVRK